MSVLPQRHIAGRQAHLRLVLAIALTLFAFFGCTRDKTTPEPANTAAAPQPPALKAVTLRLKWLYATYFGGPIVAEAKGFFKPMGLSVTVKPGGMQLDPIKLVAMGSDTFGVAGADSILLAREQGIPVVAIAAQEPKSAACFYSLKSSGIKKAEDFAGKKVGMFIGNDTETVYKALMRKLGIDRKKITEVPAPWDLRPLLESKLDVYPGYSYDQSMTLSRQKVDFNIIDPHEYGIVFLGNVYFTTEARIKEDPGLVQGFVSGTIKGWEYAFANLDESVGIVTAQDKSLKKDEQQYYLEACKPFVAPEGRKIGGMTEEDWRRTYEIMRQEDVIKKDLDWRQAYNSAYVDAYYAKPGAAEPR
jgi:NitT/TauT family transport system substrate-binding protein